MELVKYDNSLNQIVVSSKNVAESFEKRHDNVMRDIDKLKKDVLNFEEMFQESSCEDSYGRNQKCYLMNRDGFSLLAMGFTGQKALDWKLKYIEAFNTLEKEYNSPEKIMARALVIANKEINTLNEKVESLEMTIEEQKPLVTLSNNLLQSKDNISVGEMAKILKENSLEIGQNRLFQFLRDKKVLMKNNIPYQRYMDLGYFEVIEILKTTSDGVKIFSKPLITPKGQLFVSNLVDCHRDLFV